MRWLAFALALAYPLLIFAGLHWLDARVLGVCTGAILIVRLAIQRQGVLPSRRALVLPALGFGAVLILLATKSNDPRYLFLLPALINGVLLATFAASLWQPMTFIESLARMQAKDLSPEEVAYCRAVTKTWCGFFVLNAAVIVWLAFAGTPGQWATYTGFVSYLLVGLLFSAEYVFRHYRFRRYLGAPLDPLLRKLFPPRESSGGAK